MRHLVTFMAIFLLSACQNKNNKINKRESETVTLTDTTYRKIIYDELGQLYSIQFYKNDLIDGPAFFYSPDRILMDYKYYRYGRLFYYRRYDSITGRVRSYGGIPLFDIDTIVFVSPNKDPKKLYSFKLKYIEPPKSKFRAMICDWDTIESSHIDNSCIWCENIANTDSIECWLLNSNKNIYQEKVLYWSIEDSVTKDIQKSEIIIKVKEKNTTNSGLK